MSFSPLPLFLQTWVLAVLKVMRVSDPLARRHTVQVSDLFTANSKVLTFTSISPALFAIPLPF